MSSDIIALALPSERITIHLPEISTVLATTYYTVSNIRITESGDTRITESGDTRITETSDYEQSYPEIVRLILPDDHIVILLED